RLFKASKQHVPCLAHVLNLAVQAILGKDGLGAEAPTDAESLDIDNDNDESEGLIRATIAEDEHGEGFAPGETVASIVDATVVNLDNKRALQKLRKGIVKIRRSPSRLDRFKELTTTSERKRGLSPLLDVCTRWGSTYVMIKRALLCKEAYCAVLLENNLDQYILEE
ncbi:hypothetical protein BGX28_001353, partial [Mortierella sp. GBA30]